MQAVLDVNSVEKSYGCMQVLRHCSLKLYEGEIYGLLGMNGAGKTTLMKAVLGLQKIDGGSISVLGKEISGGTEYLSNLGSVIGYPEFYEHLNAEEILSMHLGYMRKKADVAEVLHFVGLEKVHKKPVSQYSLGMKQRLGLARAVIHHPKLLILDEPFNGLDPVALDQMCGFMKKLAGTGMSILLSSHMLGEIRHTADRIGILSGGWIKQELRRSLSGGTCGEESGCMFVVDDGQNAPVENLEDYVISLMRREIGCI